MGDNFINTNHQAWYSRMTDYAVDHWRKLNVGKYLPGTHSGEEAAQFYANMVVEGQRRGGAKGFFMQVGGWPGGLFASLWTPETAVSTTMTLATPLVGGWAAAQKLGSLSMPIVRLMMVTGSFQGGLSLGQAANGTDLSGNELSVGTRIVYGIAGAFTLLTLFGQANGGLFGRAKPGIPGGRATAAPLNKGAVRVGWSWRKAGLPGGGDEYFALHGGGTYKGVNQGDHFHVYLNQMWPSGPDAAPGWAVGAVRAVQVFGVMASGAYGYMVGKQYFAHDP